MYIKAERKCLDEALLDVVKSLYSAARIYLEEANVPKDHWLKVFCNEMSDSLIRVALMRSAEQVEKRKR
jgi:hypothetical protein